MYNYTSICIFFHVSISLTCKMKWIENNHDFLITNIYALNFKKVVSLN